MSTDLRRWGVAMCGDPFGLASPFAKASEDKSEATLQGVEDEDEDD
jgi:hypothetical protein